LVPVIFNVDMGMDENVSFSGLAHLLTSNPRNFENFEIFLNITGTERALTFEWSYNVLLFERSTIQRMMEEFESLLEQVVMNPEIMIGEIKLSPNTDSKRIAHWNSATKFNYPRN